jgi:hypothetical protein
MEDLSMLQKIDSKILFLYNIIGNSIELKFAKNNFWLVGQIDFVLGAYTACLAMIILFFGHYLFAIILLMRAIRDLQDWKGEHWRNYEKDYLEMTRIDRLLQKEYTLKSWASDNSYFFGNFRIGITILFLTIIIGMHILLGMFYSVALAPFLVEFISHSYLRNCMPLALPITSVVES